MRDRDTKEKPPPPPILPGFEDSDTNNYAPAVLYGRHNEPQHYRIGRPLPTLVHCNGDLYSLSDRTAAWYTFVS